MKKITNYRIRKLILELNGENLETNKSSLRSVFFWHNKFRSGMQQRNC